MTDRFHYKYNNMYEVWLDNIGMEFSFSIMKTDNKNIPAEMIYKSEKRFETLEDALIAGEEVLLNFN